MLPICRASLAHGPLYSIKNLVGNCLRTVGMGNDDEMKKGLAAFENDVTNHGVRASHSSVELYAFATIPNGYKATHVRVYGGYVTIARE